MRIDWIYHCGILFFILSSVKGANRYEPCNCNGKSISCVWDSDGPRCLNCQGNTEGRQCERCKEGFYHQRAGGPCLLCNCNSAGASSPRCDAGGACSCKPGVRGDKCDHCDNGAPVTPIGCTQSCWTGGSQSLSRLPKCRSCFCYGHADTCSPAEGYSVHAISSSFSSGTEGWQAAPAHGALASGVRFQWSSRLQSLEVFSDSTVPVYLLAPASYLGNQRLSYGQTLSFSLRLDWGARHPSGSDVVLEGAGLRVVAPLGDLHRVIPCGRRTTYSFRLDESPDSKWQPPLTSLQFQMLLQNVTAIKIRGTFGRSSRSYLDDVQLVSARQGPGTPAGWVGKCSCPVGHEGQFCERCASGYRKVDPARGHFSPCTPCSCLGDCNADTGECLPADDSSRIDCSGTSGTSDVRCNRCSAGTTGPRCNICDDGFYGDPLGESGPRRPCQRCQCNGNIDPNAVGNCHHLTGQCFRCLNHTTGFFCENCQEGFHRSHVSHSCKACSCSPPGSSSRECSSSGQCLCREGFEGLQCDRPACPSCFERVKRQVDIYIPKLHELEGLLQKMEGGVAPANTAELQRHIRRAELLLADMQLTSDQLTDTENGLLGRLEELSQAEAREASSLQSVSSTLSATDQQRQQYQRRASDIDPLIRAVRHQLLTAKADIRNAELALRDDNGDTSSISSLAEKAVSLAKKQQGEAGVVDQTAKSTLAEVQKAQGLMRPVLLGEDKIAELVRDLQIGYTQNSTLVTGMKKQAAHLSSSAERQSHAGEEMLKQISQLEPLLLDGVQGMDGIVSDLETLKDSLETSLSEYQDVKASVEAAQSGMSDLLAKGEAAQQIHNRLLSRANAAKAYADASLMGITGNMEGLLNVHGKLEGFSQQLSAKRAEAERSMAELGAIAGTVRGAISSNTQTLGVLGAARGDYGDALGTCRKLQDAVAYTEELPSTLRASHDLLKDVAALAGDMKQLEAEASSRLEELSGEADRAKRQETEAREASVQAAGTYGFVKGVKDSVDKTLRDVDALLSTSSSSGFTSNTDRKSYSELELSIADVRRMVVQQLLPRLRKLDAMDATQIAKAARLDADIDNILLDIRNLQDIRRTIPVGCFNAQPLESP